MNLSKNKVMIISISFLLGFLIIVQLRSVDDDFGHVTLKTITDLQKSVAAERQDIRDLKRLIRETEEKLIDYKTAIEQDGSIREVVENELKLVKKFAGMTDIEGPGIILKLSDSERELFEGENPNDVIVHDVDVLTILNDLKVAGAEALSINGQRILNTSEIKCAGPTITINNYTYAQPFIIKAIGDPATLDAALKAPNAYARNLREVFGLVVESHISERVRISRYLGDINLNYLVPREGL